ncbi:MAG: hypothetical protein ACRDE2_07240 [Chitinophagaceae bacterium]
MEQIKNSVPVAAEKKSTEIQKVEKSTIFNFFDKEQFEIMQRVSNLFASSELVPDMYKISDKNPKEKAVANCMIAIEMSQRIGASPLMVMQNLYIVYGKPTWSSKFLISTINTCGRFYPLKYRFNDLGMLGIIEFTEYTKMYIPGTGGGKGYFKNDAKVKEFDGKKIMNIECVAYTCEKGSDEILESSPISIKLAIQEGWYSKAGSKWPTMTRQMLMYRAASFWTNTYAPELSMGMRTEEEIRDTIDIDYEDISESLEREKKEAKKNVLEFVKETSSENERKEENPSFEHIPRDLGETSPKTDSKKGTTNEAKESKVVGEKNTLFSKNKPGF